MEEKAVTRGVVERFEGEFAILEMPVRELVQVPRSKLPENVREGDVICLNEDGLWCKDDTATLQAQERIRKRMDQQVE